MKNFEENVFNLYKSNLENQFSRYENLKHKHMYAFSGEPVMFSSPGRIEIAGNHTDHNRGKVLCAAITIDTLAAVTANNDMVINILSEGYPPVSVDITDLEVKETEKGTSEALVRGVARGMADRGYKIGGFSASTVTDVFKGAGVSSSAAFEVLVAEIINELYNQGKVSKMEKAIISQFAENNFFGKPSGLMDQSAISLGGISFIDFREPSSPVVEKVKWVFEDVAVVIVNCGGDHCNLTPEYASIRQEMEQVAKIFSKNTLRDVAEKNFYDNINILREKVSGRAILRAIHFFDENKRVERMVKAIKEGNKDKVFELINESGDSSYKLLQNCYVASDKEQSIPLALALSQKHPASLARRVHGGGFAGTILNFVKENNKEDFAQYMGKIFGKNNVYILDIREDGAVKVEV